MLMFSLTLRDLNYVLDNDDMHFNMYSKRFNNKI